MRSTLSLLALGLGLATLGACAQDAQMASQPKATSMAAIDAPVAKSKTSLKRPKPENLSFIQQKMGIVYSPLTELVGQIWFRDVDSKTFIDYKPNIRPNPSETRIVVQCLVTHEKMSFPVNNEFYGPAPACTKESDLVLAAE
jgi:hypothetical protein